MKRVPRSERMREEFQEALSEATPEHPMREFARRSAALMLQVAMEEQVEEFFGREHYGRGARRRRGWRNGYSALTVKSEAGPLAVLRPKVRGTEEPYASQTPGGLGRTTQELEALATRAYVRGLSTRDVSGLSSRTPVGSAARCTRCRTCSRSSRAWHARRSSR